MEPSKNETHFLKPNVVSTKTIFDNYLQIDEDILLLPPNFKQKYKYYRLVGASKVVFILASVKPSKKQVCHTTSPNDDDNNNKNNNDNASSSQMDKTTPTVLPITSNQAAEVSSSSSTTLSSPSSTTLSSSKIWKPKFLIHREYRHPTGKFLYGLPGGIVDEGETLEQAARRELLEETGYAASLDQYHVIGSCYAMPSLSGTDIYFVVVDGVEKVKEVELEPSENLVTCILSEDEVMDAVSVESKKVGTIVDGNLLSGFMFHRLWRQKSKQT